MELMPKPEPIVISIPDAQYWELRFRLAEHNRLLKQCEDTIAESKALVDAVAVASGLTVGQGYKLDDATKTATIVGP